MSTSIQAVETAAARRVRVTDQALIVELRDGRAVSVPLDWYPRLAEGSVAERRHWELIGPGVGVHWPDLDEDISVDGLLRGLPSGESAASLDRWCDARRRSLNRAGARRGARRIRTSGPKRG